MQQPEEPEPASNLDMSRFREQLLGHDAPAPSASTYPPVPPSSGALGQDAPTSSVSSYPPAAATSSYPLASSTSSSYPPVPLSSGAPGHPYQSSESTSPHDQSADRAPPSTHYHARSAYETKEESGADDSIGGRGSGKRELSSSKRAAQNRAAQRAFRQRKEGYIKKLEEQVDDFELMERDFHALQDENYQLREYILNLQSRLLENQSDVPPPPLHMNLQAAAAVQRPDADRNTQRAQSESRPGLPGADTTPHAAYNPESARPEAVSPLKRKASS